MYNLVTLILILHNRHRNLDRLLEYYKGITFPIIVADSSLQPHQFQHQSTSITHLYTPGLSFSEKIEKTLNSVNTPYVVMCADDDFIIPESIIKCVEFLESNKSYSVSQGICIRYNKESINSDTIEFGLVYEMKSYDIESDDPWKRLEKMFDEYRSILYAVHRTDVLKLAYNNAGKAIKNLYLNEYLTAIIPILSGKYKELPYLYQVREYAMDSDDKTTDNLDTIYKEEKFRDELDAFISLNAQNATQVSSFNQPFIDKNLSTLLERFSASPLIGMNKRKVSFKKRVGNIIKYMPLIGPYLIQKNRIAEYKRNFEMILKTEADRNQLLKIETLLKNK